MTTLPPDLQTRLAAYAETKGLTRDEALVACVRAQLDLHDARVKGAQRRWQRTTKAARRTMAQQMAAARWGDR